MKLSLSMMVNFIDPVFLCLEDILELVLQKTRQQAHFVCGFDYWQLFMGGRMGPLYYYDTWVGRTMSGNQLRSTSFQRTFEFDPKDAKRYQDGLPLQGYSCWNGLVVLSAAPFYQNIKFRAAEPGECESSECKLLAKDFWKIGYGRVLFVPTVQLVYERRLWEKVQAQKSDTLEHLTRSLTYNSSAEKVSWAPMPEKVVCFPLRGIGNMDADWKHPIWETLST